MAELISQTDYARRIGKSRQYVNKLVKAGKIPGHGARNTINPDEADAALAAIADPARNLGQDEDDSGDEEYHHAGNPSRSAGKEPSYNNAAIAHKTFQAKMAKLQYEQMAGNLVDKAEVERVAFDTAREIRDRLLSMTHEVAGSLVAMKDEKEIARFLRERVRAALAEASEDVSPGI